jgi:hypothetical protein
MNTNLNQAHLFITIRTLHVLMHMHVAMMAEMKFPGECRLLQGVLKGKKGNPKWGSVSQI